MEGETCEKACVDIGYDECISNLCGVVEDREGECLPLYSRKENTLDLVVSSEERKTRLLSRTRKLTCLQKFTRSAIVSLKD
jgi:hypothetical protein